MGKKLKIFITLVLLLALVGVIILYRLVDSKSTASRSQETNQVFTNTLDDIQKQIDQLYVNDQHDFIAETFQLTDLDTIKNNINQLNEATAVKNKYLDQLNEVNQRFEAMEAVNDLFEGSQKAIRGNKVLTNLAIKNSVTLDKIKKIKSDHYYEEETVDQTSLETAKQDEEVALGLDDFQKAINQLIDLVFDQLEQGKQIDKLFAEVEKIQIADGNMAKIALAMAKFDKELDKIKASIPDLYKKADTKANKYTEKFLTKVEEIAKNVPQYYELLEKSLEPSKRLSEALKDNRDKMEEATTSLETTIGIQEEVSTSEDNGYYYEEPEYSWTEPSEEPLVTTPTPSTSQEIPITEEPVENTSLYEPSPLEDTEYNYNVDEDYY